MLSVVIIAWNEEENLARVLSSIKKLANEIVLVVDKDTTDNTAEIGKSFGCKIFFHPHTGIVEPMRNFAISKARGDWILLLDADEEVTESLSYHIKKSLEDNKIDYFRIPRKNIIFGKWIKSSHWWPDYVYRLFKKGSLTWDKTIHSLPFTKGEGGDFKAIEDLAIIHHNYNTIWEYLEQINRYTDHQLKSIQATGYSFAWQDLLTKPANEFLNQYFSRNGYKDGIHGLVLALLQAFSEFTLYAKLWQERGFVSESVSSREVTKLLTKKSAEYKWWLYESQIRNTNFLNKILLRAKRKLGI